MDKDINSVSKFKVLTLIKNGVDKMLIFASNNLLLIQIIKAQIWSGINQLDTKLTRRLVEGSILMCLLQHILKPWSLWSSNLWSSSLIRLPKSIEKFKFWKLSRTFQMWFKLTISLRLKEVRCALFTTRSKGQYH